MAVRELLFGIDASLLSHIEYRKWDGPFKILNILKYLNLLNINWCVYVCVNCFCLSCGNYYQWTTAYVHTIQLIFPVLLLWLIMPIVTGNMH